MIQILTCVKSAIAREKHALPLTTIGSMCTSEPMSTDHTRTSLQMVFFAKAVRPR